MRNNTKTEGRRNHSSIWWMVLAFVCAGWNLIYAKTNSPTFWQWSSKPVMGWNSWDCFATTINETQTMAQADVMAEKLKSHGWQYVVIDIQWYEPGANSFDYRKGAVLAMDEYGRLWPATNRFPSSVNGVGFKALADYVHGKGLKFGLHLMRGIPRQAVANNCLILGTTFHAADIADTNSVCPWNHDNYGVDMSKPGAQAYYDSVFQLLASWDLDFVKVDDLSRPYHKLEIEAIRRAIDHTGHKIVLSTSPGATPLAEGAHISEQANQWRISDDFWDKWSEPEKSMHGLKEQFAPLASWANFSGPGHFPDADMLPLGTIHLGKRKTRLTPDEQISLMTLWSIARSPLIMGGDLTKLDDFTLSLLTNDEVLAVNQNSCNNRQLFRTNDLVAWTAEVENSPDKYLAIFNLADQVTNMPASFFSSVLTNGCELKSLWDGKHAKMAVPEITAMISPHGSRLYRLSYHQ